MIHELRIYRCAPGRLPVLNKRFETVTLKLWEKHGIRQVGFWKESIIDTWLWNHYKNEILSAPPCMQELMSAEISAP